MFNLKHPICSYRTHVNLMINRRCGVHVLAFRACRRALKEVMDMKIVIDDKIPYIRESLARIADEVVCIKGSDITADDVRDADALIVRTRTRCDKALLDGSSVRFVATATIGFDHLDTRYLDEAGITWMNCPGCNSSSVAQYVRSVLILLKNEKGMAPSSCTVGVVGCGHVGSKVVDVARRMGMRVLVCDPPLEQAGTAAGQYDFVTMEDIARRCDIITFHVPLTRDGRHATWHLADRAFMDSLQRCPVIINTSRGSVVDNNALLEALYINKVKDAVIDTWENEPDINLQLLGRVYIGTPHIAGYSADGKVNADNMVMEGLCRHFRIPLTDKIIPPALPKAAFQAAKDGILHAEMPPFATPEECSALALYNPLADSGRLKASPQSFEELRGNYPLRREKW